MPRTNGGLIQGKWNCQTLRVNQLGRRCAVDHSRYLGRFRASGTASRQRMDVVIIHRPLILPGN